MSAQYDIIAAVMRLAAMNEYQSLEGLPPPWHTQFGMDMSQRIEMIEQAPARGTENWSKQEHWDHFRFRAQNQLDAPINHEVLKGLPMKYPHLVPGDQPASIMRSGTYYWKLQL